MYEAFNWRHGTFIGASVRSEATAAAEHKGITICVIMRNKTNPFRAIPECRVQRQFVNLMYNSTTIQKCID